MKIVAAILVTALVSAGVTFLATSGKTSTPAAPDASPLKTQNSELRKALQIAEREAKKPPEIVYRDKNIIVAGATLESPEAILEYLSNPEFELKAEDRSKGNTDAHRILVRQVIRQFEELTAMGPKALPAITDFLSKDLDKEFKENTAEITSGNWAQGRMYLDPIFPPSLRIGLLNTVRHIGKREGGDKTAAENVLKGVLSTTGRALEVAYIANALEDLAKDIHKEDYLEAARELLMEPIREEGREVSFLNRQNRPMLLDILKRHKDTSFVETAKTQLIRTSTYKDREGNEKERTYIDGSVMSYLTGVLGGKAMPILAGVYDNPELDDRARSSIRQVAAGYMGHNEDANIIINRRMTEGFNLLVTDGGDAKKQKQNRDRGMNTIQYYLRRMGDGREVPAETLSSRQQFLSSLRAQTQDKDVLVWMDRTQQRLNDMGDPEKAKKLGNFDPRRDPNRPREQQRR
jgi:hypothetical protein